jgi:predicted Fe-Mo cluster-binding NifX family protein
MKIAIPLFGSRVSPRFGCESEILIVEIEEGKEINRLSSTLIRNGVEDEYCGNSPPSDWEYRNGYLFCPLFPSIP